MFDVSFQMFSALVPHLEILDSVLLDVTILQEQLQLRYGPRVDNTTEHLLNLKQEWQRFKLVRDNIEAIDTDIYKVIKQLKLLKNNEAGTEAEEIVNGVVINELDQTELMKLFKKLNMILKKAILPLRYLEDYIIPELLKLPNTISSNSPLHLDQVETSVFLPPDIKFEPKSHLLLGKFSKTIEMSVTSPGSYYLSGKLAECELALQDYVADILDRHQFLQHSNPDFSKGICVEACGMNHLEKGYSHSGEALRLIRNAAQEDASPIFLVGGASLPSFLGYFAKRIVTNVAKFMPQKLFAVGRLYNNPESLCLSDHHNINSTSATDNSSTSVYQSSTTGNDIFSSIQTTAVTSLTLYMKDIRAESLVVAEMLDIISAIYDGLGLHYRVVNLRASLLKSYEKQSYSIQMLSTKPPRVTNTISGVNDNDPSTVQSDAVNNTDFNSNTSCEVSPFQYVEIGRLSVCGSYISRRLLMLYAKEGDSHVPVEHRPPEHEFMECVYCQLLNVSKFLAVMLENTQTDTGSYRVPDALLQYMLSGAK